MAEEWRPAMDLNGFTALKVSITDGTFARPADYPIPPPEMQNRPDLVAARAPDVYKTLVANNKRSLVGTSITDVVAAYAVGLVAARMSRNPNSLLFDLILAIFVGYTVARDWSETYALIGPSSIWRDFEIADRLADNQTAEGRRAAWIATCNMNSTALHWLAHVVVEAAPAGGFLANLRASKGTVFNPPPLGAGGVAVSEQARIMREASVGLTAADREALERFRTLSPTMIRALDLIFGDVGLNLTQAINAANALTVVQF
jgi:hypothetical protein